MKNHQNGKDFQCSFKIKIYAFSNYFLPFTFRDTTNTKNSGTVPSSSSSNRSTPIQQAVPVPVPIPLNIPPTSSSSSSSNITANSVLNQQQAQLLSTIDPVAMRQQASPLQQYLGPGLSYLTVFFLLIIIMLISNFVNIKILSYHFELFMVSHLNSMVHHQVFIHHQIWLMLQLNRCLMSWV